MIIKNMFKQYTTHKHKRNQHHRTYEVHERHRHHKINSACIIPRIYMKPSKAPLILSCSLLESRYGNLSPIYIEYIHPQVQTLDPPSPMRKRASPFARSYFVLQPWGAIGCVPKGPIQYSATIKVDRDFHLSAYTFPNPRRSHFSVRHRLSPGKISLPPQFFLFPHLSPERTADYGIYPFWRKDRSFSNCTL